MRRSSSGLAGRSCSPITARRTLPRPIIDATFTPGRYYTYPPFHLALLAVLTLPVTIVAALRAPSFALHDVVGEILKVGYMTPIAYVARFVSLAMSLGIVFFLARIAEELRAGELGLVAPSRDVRVRRAGWSAAAFAGANASLTYYAHTTNLAFGGPDMRTAYVTSSGYGWLVAARWHEPGLKLHFN